MCVSTTVSMSLGFRPMLPSAAGSSSSGPTPNFANGTSLAVAASPVSTRIRRPSCSTTQTWIGSGSENGDGRNSRSCRVGPVLAMRKLSLTWTVPVLSAWIFTGAAYAGLERREHCFELRDDVALELDRGAGVPRRGAGGDDRDLAARLAGHARQLGDRVDLQRRADAEQQVGPRGERVGPLQRALREELPEQDDVGLERRAAVAAGHGDRRVVQPPLDLVERVLRPALQARGVVDRA